MSAKVCLVTGQLGIKKSQVFDKVEQYLVETEGKSCHVIPFEERLESVYETTTGEIGSLTEILEKPKRYLFELWKKTAEEVSGEIAAHSDVDYIFITTHAIYYHQGTKSFTSLYNVSLIRELMHPAMVIILIDDVIDIFQREPGFFEQGDFSDKLFWMLAILMWRDHEINASISIAQQHDDCKYYVFAVKHKLKTLALLLDDQPTAYISHSITEVKRRLSSSLGEDTSGNEIINEANALYESLTDQGIAAFFPTTIDDIRFLRYSFPPDVVWLPIMIPRWPSFPEDQVLWVKPILQDEWKIFDSGFDFGLSDDQRRDLVSNWNEAERVSAIIQEKAQDEAYVEDVKHLASWARPLVKFIIEQVNARDVTLVNQAQYLIVYRPIFAGSIAGGVKEEIRHFNQLRRSFPADYLKSFCFMCERDNEMFPARRLAETIQKEAKFDGGMEMNFDELENFVKQNFEQLSSYNGFVSVFAEKGIHVQGFGELKEGALTGGVHAQRTRQWKEAIQAAQDWRVVLRSLDEDGITSRENGEPKTFSGLITATIHGEGVENEQE